MKSQLGNCVILVRQHCYDKSDWQLYIATQLLWQPIPHVHLVTILEVRAVHITRTFLILMVVNIKLIIKSFIYICCQFIFFSNFKNLNFKLIPRYLLSISKKVRNNIKSIIFNMVKFLPKILFCVGILIFF